MTLEVTNNKIYRTEKLATKSDANKKSSKQQLSPFDTVQYVNKNDGRTYIAKKITLKQDGQEVSGIYVYDKDGKPDENGNIKGEFMSQEAFMQKMQSELPAINSDTIKAYYPNIK